MISDLMIEESVRNAGDSFDSHAIILRIAHLNQRAYVEALNEASGDKPFHTLHSRLGQRIKAVCERLGYAGVPHSSNDIFGNRDSNCILWSRR